MMILEKEILLVREDIQKRFPNCNSTVFILIWDDNTSSVECRHGTDNGKLCISKFYDNKLTYEEIDIKFIDNMMIDKKGTKYPLEKEILK